MSEKKVIPIGGGGGGGESIIVDDALSTSSTNPVQNKAITNALNNKANKSTTLAGYGITNAYTKTEVDTSLSAKANNADLSTVAKTGQYSDIKGKPSALPANGGDSETVNGHTVERDVPANAKFTDTVYTHPSTHAASMITGLSTVATSGNYSDLSNKPTIPSIPSSLPANGGNADTVGGFTVGTNVPADAKFTDTVYTLPAATTSALGGVKVGTNISVSSGIISVANGSTSTKGVVQLTNSTSSTSTTTAATPAAVKSAYDLANGKQSPATTLSGYGITNAYTKTEVDSKIASILDSAPETLNTLNELAAALGDDPNFATTVSTEIGKKANSTDLAKVATSGKYSDLSGTPSSLPANGGNAATVGGFTVGVNVPANAKFTDTIYELPNATSSVLGGVRIGSNITVSNGTISLTKSNVTSALGYTPPTKDTTYSTGTTTAAGLTKLYTGTGTNTDGTMTQSAIKSALDGKLSTSGTAAKATADASGNTITSTYATKTEVTNGLATKLNTSGGNVTGHVYLTGAQANSSTGNTSQLVFGTADDNHVAISSNNNALVINPNTTSATNQIVLYLDKASQFPNGISGNASSATKLQSNAGSTTQPIYFSGGKPVACTYTLGTSVPANAEFTDTKYTLPNATSSILGGVKIGTNISVSSGTISVADASTSAKGVVQLSSAINSTSTSLAATASAVKSAYDLANGKQSPATTLAGYGITNAYTKTETKSNFLGWNRGAYDVDTLVNAGIYMIASGSNAPSGSQYGSLLTMPYRSLTGNSTPDFGTQIFIPNGDDKTKPNSMFFRTSLSGSWNAWQEVATKSEFYTKEEVDSLVGKSLGMKATGSERTRASGKYNYGL